MAFLDAELARLPGETRRVAAICQVLDTLALARELHPGQRNSLDALCKRYDIDNSARELHGALLDARILADVYLAMTGGQGALALTETEVPAQPPTGAPRRARRCAAPVPLPVPAATAEELAAHEVMLAVIAKASGGRCLWAASEPRDAARLPQRPKPRRSAPAPEARGQGVEDAQIAQMPHRRGRPRLRGAAAGGGVRQALRDASASTSTRSASRSCAAAATARSR